MLHLRHIHKRRKRIQKKESGRQLTFLDMCIYTTAILAPLMTIPQLYEIWVRKNFEGVSLLTWSSYLFFAIIWLVYGLVKKDRPIVISNILWIAVEALVVIGIWS